MAFSDFRRADAPHISATPFRPARLGGAGTAFFVLSGEGITPSGRGRDAAPRFRAAHPAAGHGAGATNGQPAPRDSYADRKPGTRGPI